jgi:hypothetical protein
MVDLSKYRDPDFSSPVVRVRSSHPDHVRGYYQINESDFDPTIHELWEPDQIAEAAAPSDLEEDHDDVIEIRRRGRPPGSKNHVKES